MLTSDQVHEATFSTVRLGSGYDMLEVNDLLNRLASTLRDYEQGVARHDLTAAEVADTTFSQAELREGYRPDEIDEFLKEAVDVMCAFEAAVSRDMPTDSLADMWRAAGPGATPAHGVTTRVEPPNVVSPNPAGGVPPAPVTPDPSASAPSAPPPAGPPEAMTASVVDNGPWDWISEAVARLQQAGYTEVPTDLASRTHTADATDWVRGLSPGTRLVSSFVDDDRRAGSGSAIEHLRQIRILRRSKFGFSWFLTRLHVFVLLRESPVMSAVDLRAFTDDAAAWARSAKGGWPLGLQNGVAVFPVVVTRGAPPEVIARASRLPTKRWGAVVQPVVVDLDTGRAHTYAGKMAWGAVYQHFLGRQQSIVIGDLAGNTMQLSLRTAVLLIFGFIFSLWPVLLICGLVA